MTENKFSKAKIKIPQRIKITVAVTAAAIIGFLAGKNISNSNQSSNVYKFGYDEKTDKVQIDTIPAYQISEMNMYDLRAEFVDKELKKESIKIGKEIAKKLTDADKKKIMEIPFAVDIYGGNPETLNLFRHITKEDFESGEFLYYIYKATTLYGRNPVIEGAEYGSTGYGTDKPKGRFSNKEIDKDGKIWMVDTTNFNIVTGGIIGGEFHRFQQSVPTGEYFELIRIGIDKLVLVHRKIKESPQAKELEEAWRKSADIFNDSEQTFSEKQQNIMNIVKEASNDKHVKQ